MQTLQQLAVELLLKCNGELLAASMLSVKK
jgi:hypothetical protein